MPRRRRPTSRLEFFYAAVILAVMVGASLWLDRSGRLVTARVVAKQERIVVGYEPSGAWDRYYQVAAAFDRPDGSSAQATVRVPKKRYDALREGDAIEVRYLPQLPAFARTSDRSTASVVREFASAIAALPLMVWLAAGVTGLWVAARIGKAPVIAVGMAWAVAAWPMFFTPPSREVPRPMETMAEVHGITLVERSPARVVQTRTRTGRFNSRLDVPYQVVELGLPLENGDAVLAVDAVDSGSVKGLSHGARLPVRFEPSAPRDAQLVAGTRRFAEANRYHFVVPVLGSTILGVLMGLAYNWRRSARQATAEPRTGHRGDHGIIPIEGGA